MELEFTVTNEDYLEFNIFHMDNSEQIKKSLLLSRVLITMITIWVAFLAIQATENRSLIGYTYFGVLWVLCMAFLGKGFRLVCKRSIEKMLKEGKANSYLGNYVLTVTDEGITAKTDTNVMQTKWEGIERVAENRDYLFVYVGALAAYIIPVHAFADSNQKEEFKNTLNTMIGKAKAGQNLT